MIDIGRLVVCLEELASKEFQERAWLSSGPPEVSSFSELVSQTFDDTGISDASSAGKVQDEIGKEAAEMLNELDALIGEVDQSLPLARS